jgi:Domain of unknown function (DUF1918)
MAVTVGDRVEVQRSGVRVAPRTGIVESILSDSPGRYQVRWDNGRWSIISATDGALRLVSRARRRPVRPRAVKQNKADAKP